MKFQKGQSGNPTGRPRKADQNAGAVARAERQIRDRLPSLIDNMLALADGVWVEEITLEGQRNVYKRPPDRAANQYLIDRIMGKPTERREIEHSGKIDVSKLSDDELQSIIDS
jgi:hypothetical protein